PTSTLFPYTTLFRSNVEAKLRSEEKQSRLHDIFFNDPGVTSNTLRILCRYKRRPCLPKISSTENVRSHIAKSVAIEGGISSAGIDRKSTRLNSSHLG